MAAAKYTVTVTFRGRTASILQMPRDKTPDGQDNTGWCVWEASNVALRYLESDDNIRGLLNLPHKTTSHTAADDSGGIDFSKLKLVDLSSGAGLVALACAKAGASVIATDVPAQLPQLIQNVEREELNTLIQVTPLFWGEDISCCKPREAGEGKWFDIVIASDIVFIAIRDHREAELKATLIDMARRSHAVLFSFEERVIREEQDFMESLGLGATEADAAPLDVTELKGDAVKVEAETALKGAGGHADTDLWNPSLFWEPPPIRMFILRAK